MKKKLLDKEHNFISDREVVANDSQVKSIGDAATKALVLMERIERGEELLKTLKAELKRLQHEILPPLMLNAGSANFTTMDGFVLERGTKVEGSLPKDELKREEAMNLLVTLSATDLIKGELSMTFDRKMNEQAIILFDALKGKGYDPSYKADVNHMTLKAWARERLENGLEVPADKLGLWVGDWVTIKRAK